LERNPIRVTSAWSTYPTFPEGRRAEPNLASIRFPAQDTAALSRCQIEHVANFRCHGANTLSAWLTSYRIAGDDRLDRLGIKDGIWRKVMASRPALTSLCASLPPPSVGMEISARQLEKRTNSPCGLETVLSNTWPAAAAAGGRSSAPFDNVTIPSPSLRY
jgi:hypothetical protein